MPEQGRFELADLQAVLLSDIEAAPYVVEAQQKDYWPYSELAGHVEERVGVRQRLAAIDKPPLWLKYCRFDTPEAARTAAGFYAHFMAEPFEEGGLAGEHLGETCWVSESPWGAALLFQRGPFCVLVAAPLCDLLQRAVVADVARRVDAKACARLQAEHMATAETPADALQSGALGLDLEALAGRHLPGFQKAWEQRSWPWPTKALFLGPAGEQIEIAAATWPSQAEALAAAEDYRESVAEVYRQGTPTGEPLGDATWWLPGPDGAGSLLILRGSALIHLFGLDLRVVERVARALDAELVSASPLWTGRATDAFALIEHRRDELKALYDFAHWPRQDGPVRDGFKVDASVLPEGLILHRISDAPPVVSAERDWLGVSRGYQLTNPDGTGSLSVDVAVMETCAQAQERVIEVFVGSSKPQPPLFGRGGQYGLDLGDVCFAGRQRDGYFHSVMWVRNNVFVRMWASTDDLYPLVEPLARALDAAILQRATFKTYAECASRPVITAVQRVTGSEEGPRIEADWKAVELDNPRQEEIRLWPFQIPGTGVIFQVGVSESNLIGFPLPGLVPWKWVSPGYEQKNATINAFLQKYQRPPPEPPAQGDEAAPGG
jgi:hypothetical protein